jgi:hypothetical protein
MPAEGVCPFGITLESLAALSGSQSSSGVVAGPKAQAVNLPPGAAAACAECPESKACPNVSACCGGRLNINIVVPCPHGRW